MGGLNPISGVGREAMNSFSAQGGSTGANCTVTVSDYTRFRNGKLEDVSGYERHNPNCDNADSTDVVLARGGGRPSSAGRQRRAASPPVQTPRHSLLTPRAWEGQPNQAWRQQIAAEETRRETGDYGYGMGGQPGSSALGRYQMLRDLLAEAGWKDRTTGAWTAKAADAGVQSNEQFLANPQAQEAALNDAMRANERLLGALGASSLVGQEVPGMRDGPVPVTEGGLAAAAHREGAPSVARYLNARQQNQPIPPSVAGRRGDLSRFNEIERRLRAFAETPYERMRR